MPKQSHDTDYNPGEFGYRTRGRRSGLDPIENQMEFARAQGIFIRNLLTGNLRTRNPIYLLLMAILASILIYGTAQLLFNPRDTSSLIATLPISICMGSIGLGFLFSLLFSLWGMVASEKPKRRKHKHRDQDE